MKLHLGCGAIIKPGWINIGLNPLADVIFDLCKAWPFPENSCEMIYSEHFLEHIDYPEPATFILKEAFRVLQPGGVIETVVPDAEELLLAYAGKGRSDYFSLYDSHYPRWCVTKMECINFLFRQILQDRMGAGTEHRFAYDFETLSRALQSAGFTDIQRRNYDPKIDSEKSEIGSLMVSARKNTK